MEAASPTSRIVVVFATVLAVLALLFRLSFSSTFTLSNNCPHPIWPGTLAGSGTPELPTTGFKLDSGQTARILAPPGWSGRIWARTECKFDSNGAGTCQTGDCGGRMECGGAGALPPVTLFEITFGKGLDKDFYDVSLVDGYNLPLVAAPRVLQGGCNMTGCLTDLNHGCPKELQVQGVGGVVACKSACEAFGLDEYCCSGEFATADSCKPSFYSKIFKTACPNAYSYAFDDGTSTFTCKAYDYTIVFCPDDSRSRSSYNYSTGQPTTGQPARGQPAMGQPATGQPTTGQPTTSQPTTGQPTNEGDGDEDEPVETTSSASNLSFHLYLFLPIFFLLG